MIQIFETKDQKRNLLSVLYEGYGKELLYMIVHDNLTGKIRLLDLQSGNLWDKEWSTINELLAEEDLYLAQSSSIVVQKY